MFLMPLPLAFVLPCPVGCSLQIARAARKTRSKEKVGPVPRHGMSLCTLQIWQRADWTNFFFRTCFTCRACDLELNTQQDGEARMQVAATSETQFTTFKSAVVVRLQMNDERNFHQEEGKNRSEMQKKLKMVRCALLNGSAWSTDRKYMRRYRGTFDVLFEIGHRIRREELEEQFNKESKQGWRFAADAANHRRERKQ